MVENKDLVKQIGRFDDHEDARVRKLTNEMHTLNLSLIRIANGLADICASLASLESRFVEEEDR